VENEPKESAPSPKDPRGRSWLWIAGPVALFALLVVLILNTGTPSANTLLKDAATSFSKVKRGTFDFAITVTPQGADSAKGSTVELRGPFEIVPDKPLPRAHITYTVSSGGRSNVVTLVTTGDKAYSVIRGQAYELPPAATKQLKSATKDLKKDPKSSGLSGLKLNFDRWLVDPTVTDGGQIAGTPVWRTQAGINLVDALKDLAGSLGTLGAVTGGAVPKLKDAQLAEVQKQIKAAKAVVYVGRYDHIVRKVDLTLIFKTPKSAAAATGGISGGSMNMRIGIANPNQAVDVSPPKNPLPYSALQSLVKSSTTQTGTTLDDGLGK
jgi:hypothetical protein